jgi:hypothetical protein
MNFINKILLRKKIKRKFSDLFKNALLNKKKDKIILLEFHNSTFTHIGSSYVCDILSKKHNARIEAFPAYQLAQSNLKQTISQKLLWYFGNLLSLKTFGIYKSFGVAKIFWPKFKDDIYKKSLREFKNYNNKIRKKEDVENYKIEGILVGDLIYDSFLKKKLYPTIEIESEEFKNFFFESIMLFFFWKHYFKNNKVSAVILFHSVYLSALPSRISISKKIPTYIVNIEKLYCLDDKRKFIGLEYLDYKKRFNMFSKSNKNNKLIEAESSLLRRFNGKLSSDLIYTLKSAFGKKTNKRVLKRSNRLKILIAPHSFCDSPHFFGNAFFPDNFEWLKNLGKISNKTNYDWYIKCHPDFTSYFDNTPEIVKDFVKKYPKIKMLEASTSHNQLINEGIDYVLTVYGTISGEYPYFGINAINASSKHTQAKYTFTITPKNRKYYIKLIKNLKRRKKLNKRREILEHYYMKYKFYNNGWFFNDLNEVKKSVNGYHNLVKLELYKYWIENFDLKNHFIKYKNLEKFFKSKSYVFINNQNNS